MKSSWMGLSGLSRPVVRSPCQEAKKFLVEDHRVPPATASNNYARCHMNCVRLPHPRAGNRHDWSGSWRRLDRGLEPARRKWERVMFDPLNKADRYRAVAAEFANLAQTAPSDFSRGYYRRIADRYQLLAEGGSDLPHDDASPSISPAACSPPLACTPPDAMEPEPKPADAGDRGFVQVMLKVARRVSLLPSRRAN